METYNDNKFIVYLPLTKGINPEDITSEVEDISPTEQKTRFKFKGVASTTALDRDDEKVSKSCLLRMVKDIKTKKLPIFGNHEHGWENMLGYADDAELIDSELHINIVSDYMETNPKVVSLKGKLDAGLPLGLSIGGKVQDYHDEYEPNLKKKIKVIDAVKLLETSVVGIAANPDAYLSLPEQISKSLKIGKEGVKLSNMHKSAAELGNVSYGKLGETIQQQMCPECGHAAELRSFQDGQSIYVCPTDGKVFKVDLQGKVMSADPLSQPSSQPMENIEQQIQKPLGRASKSTTLKTEKGENMKNKILKKKKMKKEEEPEEEKSESEEEEEEEEEEEKMKKTMEEEEEEGYEKFKKYMARFKAEGVTEPPGEENANEENTIEGKSVKKYNVMRKAFKDNPESESEEVPEEKNAYSKNLSFKSFRNELMKK